MEKVFHIERKIVKTIRPFAKRIIDTPLPTERVFDSVEILYQSISKSKNLIAFSTVLSLTILCGTL